TPSSDKPEGADSEGGNEKPACGQGFSSELAQYRHDFAQDGGVIAEDWLEGLVVGNEPHVVLGTFERLDCRLALDHRGHHVTVVADARRVAVVPHPFSNRVENLELAVAEFVSTRCLLRQGVYLGFLAVGFG